VKEPRTAVTMTNDTNLMALDRDHPGEPVTER